MRSNLQRQVLYSTADIGRPKVEVAANAPGTESRRRRRGAFGPSRLGQCARSSSADYDVVVDGTDNFPTRYLTQRCLRAARQAERLRLDLPLRGTGERLRCPPRSLLSLPLPRAARHRVPCPRARRGACSASCPGTIALVQATETLKLLTGIGSSLVGRLLLYDALEMELARVPAAQGCRVPGLRRRAERRPS